MKQPKVVQTLLIEVKITWNDRFSKRRLESGKKLITDTVKFNLDRLNGSYIGINKSKIYIISNLLKVENLKMNHAITEKETEKRPEKILPYERS